MGIKFGGMSSENMRLAPYSLLKDILRQFWVILLVALSVTMLSFVWIKQNYHPQYTSKTTFVVTQKGMGANTYGNLSAAESMASSFSSVLSSSVLQHMVAEDLGMDTFPATTQVEVIENTNLIELSVTASSPRLAFETLEMILDDYSQVSDYIISGMILDTLSPAQVPTAPSNSMQLSKRLSIAFFVSVVAMSLLFGFFSFMKDTVKTEADVKQKLDTSHIGTIYHERKSKNPMDYFKKKQISMLITSPLMSFSYTESLRMLATKVRNRMDARHAKTLVVGSVIENEGKSTIAANIALGMAQEGKKVILLDADLRKPAQYKIFGLSQDQIKNFGECLEKNQFDESYLYQSKEPNLKLVLTTQNYNNSTEMMSTAFFQTVLEQLKSQADYLIIDTSPVALTADVEEIMRLVDAAVLVVRQDMVLVRDINDAIDVLNLSSTKGTHKVLGCVFNNVFRGLTSLAPRSYGGYLGGYAQHTHHHTEHQ